MINKNQENDTMGYFSFFTNFTYFPICLLVLMLLAVYINFKLSKKVYPKKHDQNSTSVSFFIRPYLP